MRSILMLILGVGASVAVLAAPPAFVTESLPSGRPNTGYEAKILVGSDAFPLTVQVAGLPPGLNAAHDGSGTVTLSGVTSNGGTYWVEVTAQNRDGVSKSTLELPIGRLANIPQRSGAVATTGEQTCYISNGGVYCYLAATRDVIPVLQEGTGATKIALYSTPTGSPDYAYTGGCALVDDGLLCWPFRAGQPGEAAWRFPKGAGITDVSLGMVHGCVVVNGGVKCWGTVNEFGQIGGVPRVRGFRDNLTPEVLAGSVSDVVPRNGGATAVSVSRVHSCAIVNGGVKCWGNSALVDTYSDASLTPIDALPANSGVTSLATSGGNYKRAFELGNWIETFSETQTCAVVRGGLTCWGSFGRVTGTATSVSYNSTSPVEVLPAGSSVLDAIVGYGYYCALRSGGVQCVSERYSTQSVGFELLGGLSRSDVVVVAHGFRDVPIDKFPNRQGFGHVCALLRSGGLSCFGNDSGAQLFSAVSERGRTSYSELQLVFPAGAGATGVSASGVHACAIIRGGVQCWGSNERGALGDGTQTPSVSPVIAISPGSGVTAVSSAFYVDGGIPSRTRPSTCAIVDGGIQCWGANSVGNLGDGTRQDRLSPVWTLAAKSGATAISQNVSSGCAVVRGELWCWGARSSSSRPEKVPVPGSALTDVSDGNALCTVQAGGVRCLGPTAYNGGVVSTGWVEVFPEGSGVLSISGSPTFTCARFTQEVNCWGQNESGQLGISSIAASDRPVTSAQIKSNSQPAQIAVGDSACLLADGRVRCWGPNTYGELGFPASANRVATAVPTLVGAGVTQIAMGATGVFCAVINGGVACRGRNDHAQTGRSPFATTSSTDSGVANWKRRSELTASLGVSVTEEPYPDADATLTLTLDTQGKPISGTVAFLTDGAPLPGCAAKAVVGPTPVTCSFTLGDPGSYGLTAQYSGDANWAPLRVASVSGVRVLVSNTPPPVLPAVLLPAATIGQPYPMVNLQALGGGAPVTHYVLGSGLGVPNEVISLDRILGPQLTLSSSGFLSGSLVVDPTYMQKVGMVVVRVVASDALGRTSAKRYPLRIIPVSRPTTMFSTSTQPAAGSAKVSFFYTGDSDYVEVTAQPGGKKLVCQRCGNENTAHPTDRRAEILFPGLTPGVSYTFSVQGFNQIGASDVTPEQNRQPATPTSGTLSAVTQTKPLLGPYKEGDSVDWTDALQGVGLLTAVSTDTCRVVGNRVELLLAGVCTLAARNGTSTTAAVQLYVRLDVMIGQTVGIARPVGAYTVGQSVDMQGSSSLGLPIEWRVTGSACTVNGARVTFRAVGLCTIMASQAGTPSVAGAQQSLDIDVRDKPSPQLAIERPASTLLGRTITLRTTSLSRGKVTLQSALAGCRLEGDQLTLVSVAGCYVAADQEATTDYAASRAVLYFNVVSPVKVQLTPSRLVATLADEMRVTVRVTGVAPSGKIDVSVVPADGAGESAACARLSPVSIDATAAQVSCLLPNSVRRLGITRLVARFEGDDRNDAGQAAALVSFETTGILTLASNVVRPTVRETITLTAQLVTSQVQPSGGTVSFTRNGFLLPGCSAQPVAPLPAGPNGVVATCSLAAGQLPAGSHTIIATFTGPGLPSTAQGTLDLPVVAVGPDNYTDMWWGGEVENGWGMSIMQKGDVQFNVLYVYDDAGKPVWYVMPGGSWDQTYSRFTGAVYKPKGSAYTLYDASHFVPGVSVGSVSLLFTSASTATLQYTLDGKSGSKSIKRQVLAGPDSQPRLQVNDLWWGGATENGWGLNVAQQERTLFAVWYTYDAAGVTTWMVVPGGTWSGNVFTGDLYTTKGSPWLGAAYQANQLVSTKSGTLMLNFRDANTAEMTAVVNGTTVSKIILRQPY